MKKKSSWNLTIKVTIEKGRVDNEKSELKKKSEKCKVKAKKLRVNNE